ncbi:MAG: hypothetical protein JNM63_01840, partial [Spirochaetia bacterium]|nr:hypothetical protein [Spirochaetia bacterium]
LGIYLAQSRQDVVLEVSINGAAPEKISIQKDMTGPYALTDLPLNKGKNAIRISPVSDSREIFLDALTFDFSTDEKIKTALVKGFPLTLETGGLAQSKKLAVDVSVEEKRSGQSEVSGKLFGFNTHNGINALGEIPAFAEDVKKIRPGMIKGGGGFIIPIPEKPLETIEAYDAYFDSEEPLKKYNASFWNAGKFQIRETTKALGTERMYIGSETPKWMPREGNNLGWNAPPKDDAVYVRFLQGFFQTVRRVDPEARLLYFWNEPDSGWWRIAEPEPGISYTDYFYRLLRKTSKGLKEKYPDIKIGGPTTWTRPLSSEAGEWLMDCYDAWYKPIFTNRANWEALDFIDFHFYDRSALDILGELDFLAAAQTSVYGSRKPASITESGYSEGSRASHWDALDAGRNWRYRAAPYARYLLTLAGNPDRIWVNMIHDLRAGKYGIYSGLDLKT